jgi:hypothetical protein
MRSGFELFDPEAPVRRRIGEAPRHNGRRPARCSTRSIRRYARGLSVAAGAGLAMMALGAFRAPPPGLALGPERPSPDASDAPSPGPLDAHRGALR